MRADGSPRIRLSTIGMGPAVGRAQPTSGPLRLGFQSRASPWWGSEMLLWFEMAVFRGCSARFCVWTSVCICHLPLIKLDVGHQTFCWHIIRIAYHVAMQVWCGQDASHPACFVLFFSFVGLSEWTALYPFTCHLQTRPSRYYGKDNPHAELGGSQLLLFFLVVLKELSRMH